MTHYHPAVTDSMHQLPAMNLASFFLRPMHRSPASREGLGPGERGLPRPRRCQGEMEPCSFNVSTFHEDKAVKMNLHQQNPEIPSEAVFVFGPELEGSLGKC